MTIELHTAWTWTCPQCEKANFVKAKVGEADQIIKMLDEGEAGGDAVAALQTEEGAVVDGEQIDEETHERFSPYVIQELAIAPWQVTCQHCGHREAAALKEVQEPDDDPGSFR